ncbi:hypothetical protein DPMN_085177 [Dreissena polymorpha]|uniref:Uncharacterized protein n=1 Tax=Dreissena polymorpha TaxID=45954 RepID=A0A9D4BCM7_DREPO|nr:hypothetical protein DPMN_085177 [Dreissena polymorpha]
MPLGLCRGTRIKASGAIHCINIVDRMYHQATASGLALLETAACSTLNEKCKLVEVAKVSCKL